jgi:hypothetical protein
MSTKAASKKASIKTLHADPDNARTISTKGQQGLKTSTKKFGDLSGIVFNDLSGELVTGHQRIRVLRRAGAKEWIREGASGYILHPETGERFNVRIVEWDDATARAANIDANNPQIGGTYTEDAIDQIRELEEGLGEEFQDLAFGDLEASLEKELRKASRAGGDDGLGEAGDETDELTDAFMVMVECKTEEDQRVLIDRFVKEGLKCRALT